MKVEKVAVILIIILCVFCAIGNLVTATKYKDCRPTQGTESRDWQPYNTADIGLVEIEGTIVNSNGDGFMNRDFASSTNIVKSMERAKKDNVKGIILKINSPGGTASGAQAVYNEIVKLKKAGIKIVTCMDDLAASGGYYIASASDVIVAYPSTLTGSIGVIAYVHNLKGLMDKIGVNSFVIKSGKHKDIGSPYREMTKEEQQIFQEIIDDVYNLFIEAVSDGRKMPQAKVRELADGRIYTAHKAKLLGLVDKLGGYDEAISIIKEITKLNREPKIYNYTRTNLESIFDRILGGNTFSKLNNILTPGSEYYLKSLYRVPLMLYDGYNFVL